jgi:hypothetical protein
MRRILFLLRDMRAYYPQRELFPILARESKSAAASQSQRYSWRCSECYSAASWRSSGRALAATRMQH